MENEALAAVLQSMAAKLDTLTETVAVLVEERATPAGSSPPSTSSPPSAALSSLTECDPERDADLYRERWALAMQQNLPVQAADVLARLGARGLYRSAQGRRLIAERGRAFHIALIEDAQREDVPEAQRMGRDLLKNPSLGNPPPL